MCSALTSIMAVNNTVEEVRTVSRVASGGIVAEYRRGDSRALNLYNEHINLWSVWKERYIVHFKHFFGLLICDDLF